MAVTAILWFKSQTPPVELGRFMTCMAVAEELMVPSYQFGKPEAMLALADIYGVDVKALREVMRTGAKKQPGEMHKEEGEHQSSARKKLKRKAE